MHIKINNHSNYNTNNAKEKSNRYFLSLQVLYFVLLYKIRIGEFRLSCVRLQIGFKLVISVIEHIVYEVEDNLRFCKGEIALLLYDLKPLRYKLNT